MDKLIRVWQGRVINTQTLSYRDYYFPSEMISLAVILAMIG